MVIRKFRRAAKGQLSAVMLSDLRNLLVIRGYDDSIELLRGKRRLDRMANHRLAGKRLDILAGDSFASAACGDDRGLHPSNPPNVSTTNCCCSWVIAGKSGIDMARS